MKAKKKLEIYKIFYALSVGYCVCIVALSSITNPLGGIIANVFSYINLDFFHMFKGGRAADPDGIAKILDYVLNYFIK